MLNALEIKEFLNKYTDEELKNMNAHIENITFDDIILELRDSFTLKNVAVDNYKKHFLECVAHVQRNKLIYQEHMPGAADRQPFGNPFHNPVEDCFQHFH